MRLNIICICGLAAVILAGSLSSCGGKKEKGEAEISDSTAIDLQPKAKGDMALYGLACDGCTDSVIVILPYEGGNPDTFDIIDAKQNHKVLGRPKIGARIAVMLNPEDSVEATMVVNLDDLKGSWCYLAMPKFRDKDKMSKRVRKRMEQSMPDSARNAMLIAKEMGIDIKRNFSVEPIGMNIISSTTDEQSPLEYPEQKMYSEWRLYNGNLLLISEMRMPVEGTDSMAISIEADTAEIVMLMPDSLVLRFSDGIKSYYRQKK